MRVMLQDCSDGLKCGVEIHYVSQDTEIRVDCQDMTEQTVFEFDNILSMQDITNEWLYVVLPSREECEMCFMELVEKGYVDLTRYAETTFMYPDDEDLPRL